MPTLVSETDLEDESSPSTSEAEEDTDADSESGGEDGGSASGSDMDHDPARRNVPFGQLLQEQQAGVANFWQPRPKDNLKLKSSRLGQDSGLREESAKQRFKRENKNRPVEMSSKKPVSRQRDVIQIPNRHSRDPRFDESAGKLKDDVFKHRYSFIFDESLPQEKADLRKQLKKVKSLARKKELQGNLTRVEQQICNEADARRRKEIEAKAKAEEKAAVKAGKRPYFLKKSEKKRQELIQKYHDLKASGKLQKVVAKRRKKNAAKDHRYIPSTRRE